MPAYNREAICQFCNTKIIPPKKGFRSSANEIISVKIA